MSAESYRWATVLRALGEIGSAASAANGRLLRSAPNDFMTDDPFVRLELRLLLTSIAVATRDALAAIEEE